MAYQQHDYWDSFYTSRRSAEVPDSPSDFAQWISDRIESQSVVLEFGFGNARDSMWFARRGHEVVGYDFAESAVQSATDYVVSNALNVQFSVLDLYDREAVMQVAKQHAEPTVAPKVIYGRFLIHSLETDGRQNLLSLAATVLEQGGSLCLEFRTGHDQQSAHVFGDDHYRNYVDSNLVVREIEDFGGSIIELVEGHGIAVYKNEDPHVARIRASWKS